MSAHCIIFEVSLQDSVPQMQQLIQAELRRRGHSLNWWVIDADSQRQTITVEALMQAQSYEMFPT